jgi:hypothetical protein
MPINNFLVKRAKTGVFAVLLLLSLLFSVLGVGSNVSADNIAPDGARVTESVSCKSYTGTAKEACSWGYGSAPVGPKGAKHITPTKDYDSDANSDAVSVCADSKYKSDANLKACQHGYKDGHYAYYHATDHNPATVTPTKIHEDGSTFCDSNPKSCNDPAADPNAKCDNDDCDFIKKFINPAINTLSACFGIIAVISIILGGINYATSEGDPQKTSRAKNRIFNTIVAVVAYIFLYAFLQFLIPGGAFK